MLQVAINQLVRLGSSEVHAVSPCPHPEPAIFEDYISGDRICQQCGLVVAQHIFDVRTEVERITKDQQNGEIEYASYEQQASPSGSLLMVPPLPDRSYRTPAPLRMFENGFIPCMWAKTKIETEGDWDVEKVLEKTERGDQLFYKVSWAPTLMIYDENRDAWYDRAIEGTIETLRGYYKLGWMQPGTYEVAWDLSGSPHYATEIWQMNAFSQLSKDGKPLMTVLWASTWVAESDMVDAMDVIQEFEQRSAAMALLAISQV